jgi:hypothetical protein
MLIAGYDETASGLNINGSVKGALLFSVPAGWRLSVDCVNRSSTAYYSCALARSPGAPSPQQGLLGVLHPTSGLAPGGSASFALPLRAPGLYRLVAVTGAAGSYTIPAGMWALLRVSAGGAPYARWRR